MRSCAENGPKDPVLCHHNILCHHNLSKIISRELVRESKGRIASRDQAAQHDSDHTFHIMHLFCGIKMQHVPNGTLRKIEPPNG